MPNPAGSTDPASGTALPNQASYDTSTAGVVFDNVTHLTWQQLVPGERYTWDDAQSYCANLSLAGHDDWRLPSVIELYSLVAFGQRSAQIDPTAFPGTPADQFWSSTPVPSGTSAGFDRAWVVGFWMGVTNSLQTSGTLYVRCAR